jgi:hypothetical protein
MINFKDSELSNVVKGCKAFEDAEGYYEILSSGQKTTIFHVMVFAENKEPLYLDPDSFAFVNWLPSYKTSPFKGVAFKYRKEADAIANIINCFALGTSARVLEEKTII